MNCVIKHLFETKAVKVCQEDNPFWLTSGKISPYFINTHFLYGSQQASEELLSFIDVAKEEKQTMPKQIFERVMKQYETNTIYHEVIDEMIRFIKEKIAIEEIDYISGGERRDWFFSYLASYFLQKPQLTIFKDLTAVTSDANFSHTEEATNLTGKKLLHIADLITVASSYIRAWIPVIQDLGGELVASISVVDRMQGGSERLQDLGIRSYSMIQFNESLFKTALEHEMIKESQYEMVTKYCKDPDGTMQDFINSHPHFIEDALHADPKTQLRANLCIENHFYNQ